MDKQEYRIMRATEDWHWWFKGMERIVRTVLDKFYSRRAGLRILDAGCGSGGMMGLLKGYGTVTGLDLSPWALELAAERGERTLVRGSITRLPFVSGSFDLVTTFDVVCVLGEEDIAALTDFHRVLAPGGRLLIRVPACSWLRGAHDVAVDVRRRYSTRSLAGRLKEAGFVLDLASYANFWMFPVAALKRWSERFLPHRSGSDLNWDPGRLNPMLTAILGSEAGGVVRRVVPIGLSVIALARKE